jgi:hypothetical protein
MLSQEKEARKLATAVVALFNLQTKDEAFTDADEALNEAAFLLSDKAPCGTLDFGMFMVQAGCDLDTVTDFLDMPNVWLTKHIERYNDRPAMRNVTEE